MTATVYIAVSIDGYIADAEGGLDWLAEGAGPDDGDLGFAEFMDSIDALVMGRRTFDVVCGFGHWPYTKPVFVLTNTLEVLSEDMQGKAELISGEPQDVIGQLATRGYHSLYIDGGRTVQAFLAQDLIDRLIITRIPVLLGAGAPLFGDLDRPLRFELLDTRMLAGRMVQSTYERMRQ
ncbi:MAG: dihydrofolate reductase family protein [Pseudomonadota bacterium]